MATDATKLAQRLLDAHVDHVVARLTADDGARTVGAELRDALAVVGSVRVGDVVDAAAVTDSVAEVVAATGDAAVLREMATAVAERLYALPANGTVRLGDVVAREHVDAAVTLLAGSERLHEEVLRRLARSQAVSSLALRFVSALVGDAVQQNRQRAEKLPGAKLAFGVGDMAARGARNLAPKQLEKVVGGAADRGAQAAMERVSRALVDTLDAAAVRAAVMEVWDQHAGDPVAALQGYLDADEVAQLVASGHGVWTGLHGGAWFRAVVTTVLEGFVERHGDQTVAELLAELGCSDDVLVAVVERHAPAVLASLAAEGRLAALVRAQLAPFYASDELQALLAEAVAG